MVRLVTSVITGAEHTSLISCWELKISSLESTSLVNGNLEVKFAILQSCEPEGT